MCESTGSKMYKNPEHINNVSLRMRTLMMRKQYCDVEIIVKNKKFLTHSIILAGCSNYFETQLDGNSPFLKQIIIEDVECDAVERLIHFCYTGSIEINRENVKSIASVANVLQFNQIVEFSCDFMKKNIDSQNCLEILEWAKPICSNLHEFALMYTNYNFGKVSKTESFLDIHVDTLIDLLKFDLCELTEANVFYSVKKWLESDRGKRSRHILSVFECIKLPLLPSRVLLEAKSMCQLESKCENLMTEALEWQLLLSRRNTLKSFRTKPRKSATALLILGSWDINVSPKIEVYNPIKNEWFNFMDLAFDRRHFKAILFQEELIIIGGYKANQMTDMVESLNLLTEKRTTMASLNKPRGFLAAAVMGNAIYVAGGHDASGVTNLVEKWSLETKKWTYVTPMMHARDGCHAVVLNDEIFVIGGFDKVALTVTEAYSPTTGKWRQCASMVHGRMYYGVAVSKGYIYVVGGRVKNHHITEKYSSVERYDPIDDKWIFMANISSPRYGIVAEEFHGKIYVFNGADGQKALKEVEVYDAEKNEWSIASRTFYGRETPSVVEVPWNLVKYKSTCP